MNHTPTPPPRSLVRRMEAEGHERMRQQALADGAAHVPFTPERALLLGETTHQASWFGIDAANDDPSPEAEARRVQADRDVAAWKAPGGEAQRRADYLALCDQVRRDNQRGY